MADNMLDVIFEQYERTDEKITKKADAFSVDDMAQLGAFAPVVKQLMQSKGGEGIYRVTFPKGVTGKLATKEGANIGAIMNNGIKGQARLTQIPVNPETLFMATVLMGVNKKLNNVQDTQERIINVLDDKEKGEVRGTTEALADIYERLSYSTDIEKYRLQKGNVVSSVQKDSLKNANSYSEHIRSAINRVKTIHGNWDVIKVLDEVKHYFPLYKLALINYSFASVLEAVLNETYDSEYLQGITESIRKQGVKYREFYTECYNVFEKLANGSIDIVAADAVSKFGRFAETKLSKIPLISKTPIDEINGRLADFMGKVRDKGIDGILDQLIANKDSEIQVFMDSIQQLDRLHNRPVEMLIDDKFVYLLDELNSKIQQQDAVATVNL